MVKEDAKEIRILSHFFGVLRRQGFDTPAKATAELFRRGFLEQDRSGKWVLTKKAKETFAAAHESDGVMYR